MINILNVLPDRADKIYVACSGGVDSMVALDFLVRGGRFPAVLFFDHGTIESAKAKKFLTNHCQINNFDLKVGEVSRPINTNESKEEYWREMRYEFFSNFIDGTIVMAHHLDDVIETWIFSSLNGNPKIIPYRRNNIIRPFLLNTKKDIQEWAKKKYVTYIEDESNKDLKYARNRIRHRIVPEALLINKGLHKVIRKKILSTELET